MDPTFELSPDVKLRVERIAARSGRSVSAVIEDALQNGHSLDWQERFVEQVSRGIAAAEDSAFATPAEIDRLRGKYRSS